MTELGFDEGRVAELAAMRRVCGDGARLLAEVWRPGWRRVLLAGIGASHAALASPLYQLRGAGLAVCRTDCSDMPTLADPAADVVIAVSQSGRSRETVDLVRRLRSRGVPTIAITNTDSSPLRSLADRSVTLGGAPDSRVSTVGFVTTYCVLGMLVDLAGSGRIDNRWSTLPTTVEQTRAAAAPALAEFARRYLADGCVDIVADAAQLTSAEAAALLLREGPLVGATAYPTRSYLHGPMDVAGNGVAHILIGGARESQLAEQLRQKTSATMLLTDASIPVPAGTIAVESPSGLTCSQRALVETCVLQDLVALVAGVRGNPVDDVSFVRQDTKVDSVAELG